MPSITLLLPLLLPVAAASGWFAALRRKITTGASLPRHLSREYFIGLNFLLNEQPDKAVDVFIRLLEVDTDTVEMHLTLGSLFRRRGEAERAIRIHQNLIARPQLTQEHRIQALLALGRDYMSAGVFDRAENLFKEVIAINGDQTENGLKYLLDIYQQEKSWENAIHTANRLEVVMGENQLSVIAHYYCELATESLATGDFDMVMHHVKNAIVTNKNSVRASLLLGELEQRRGNFASAIKAYKQVPSQAPSFISEIIAPILHCYRQLSADDEAMVYLQGLLHQHPRISLVLALADRLRQRHGVDVATDFFAEHLQSTPSIRGVNQLIEWHFDNSDGRLKAKLGMLLELTQALVKQRPVYRCNSCGFGAKTLLWLCPSCRQWDEIKPIQGIDGE